MAVHDRRSGLLSAPAVLLLLFVAADLAFVALHVINDASIHDPLYALDVDRSYSDVFQQVKLFWLALLLGLVSIEKRIPLYGAWAAMFGYLVLDDAFGLRERAGAWIAAQVDALSPPLGFAGQELGELAAAAGSGGVLLAVIALLFRSSGWDARSVSKDLLLLFGVLVFFDVFFDPIQAITGLSWAHAVAIVIEDAGELIVLSLMVAYAFGLWLRNAAARHRRM